jgi:hypothetical protein
MKACQGESVGFVLMNKVTRKMDWSDEVFATDELAVAALKSYGNEPSFHGFDPVERYQVYAVTGESAACVWIGSEQPHGGIRDESARARLATVISDSLGWEWSGDHGVPSAQEACLDVADAVLAALEADRVAEAALAAAEAVALAQRLADADYEPGCGIPGCDAFECSP